VTRRALWLAALSLGLAFLAFAQEGSASGAETGDPWLVWKWINFAILAAGLGYLIGKAAPAYFQSRRAEIQQALTEATREIKDAQAKAADLELRFSSIKNEIERLRGEARSVMTVESQRIRQETEKHLKRIEEQTEQEITLMTRAAREELHKYSARLALELAGERIKTRMTGDTDAGLVDRFVSDLRHRARSN
jgi:F-type H+-transporting ATPase subunit b